MRTVQRDSAGPAQAARPARRRRPQARTAPYVFLFPAAVFFVAFLLLPILYALWLSFRDERVTGAGIVAVREEVFVGLSNYASSLADSELWASLGRMLVYGVLVVPTMLGLALLFALILDSPGVRMRSFGRIAIFLPYAVPGVIATLLWGFMYLPNVSPIRAVVEQGGLPPPDFFTPTTVFFSVANIAVWGGIGFNMIVLYTALRALPSELYDSARLDGCSERQIALRIKIPLLTPALVMTGIFSLIATLQVFNEPQTLSPLTNVISSTWMPLMKVYNDAFVTNEIYAAAATSVLLAVASLAISLGVLSFLQARAFGEDR
jgi:multiple sugar transport system permease protein